MYSAFQGVLGFLWDSLCCQELQHLTTQVHQAEQQQDQSWMLQIQEYPWPVQNTSNCHSRHSSSGWQHKDFGQKTLSQETLQAYFQLGAKNTMKRLQETFFLTRKNKGKKKQKLSKQMASTLQHLEQSTNIIHSKSRLNLKPGKKKTKKKQKKTPRKSKPINPQNNPQSKPTYTEYTWSSLIQSAIALLS